MAKNRHMEMRTLVCQLTDEELDAKMRELARVTVDAKEQEEAIDTYRARVKEELKSLDDALTEKHAARIRLAREISTRRVERDVPCDWHFDLESGQAILVRRDTQMAVAKRELTQEERQLRIGEALEAANAEQVALWEQQLIEAAARGEETGAAPTDPAPDADGGEGRDDEDDDQPRRGRRKGRS